MSSASCEEAVMRLAAARTMLRGVAAGEFGEGVGVAGGGVAGK